MLFKPTTVEVEMVNHSCTPQQFKVREGGIFDVSGALRAKPLGGKVWEHAQQALWEQAGRVQTQDAVASQGGGLYLM